ncbi:MAG: PAS domain S-box protein [Hahellaceae bacterium]|nr:PAS domain S-box protein [Hahellaceae bacterium]
MIVFEHGSSGRLQSLPLRCALLVLFLLAGFIGWQLCQQFKASLQLKYLESKKQEFSLFVVREAQELVHAMERMGNRWLNLTGSEYELWRLDVEGYRKDYPYIKRIAWIDDYGQVRWIDPVPEPGELMARADFSDIPLINRILDISRQRHESQMSERFSSVKPGVSHMLVASPLFAGEQFHGWLVALIDNNAFFSFLKLPSESQDLIVRILQSDSVSLYGEASVLPSMGVSNILSVYGQEWEVWLSPTPGLVDRLNLWQVNVVYASFVLLLISLIGLGWFAIIRSADARFLSSMLLTQETVLDSLTDGLIIIDRNGVVRSLNRAAREMFGYTDTEIMGVNFKMLLGESTRSEHENLMRRLTLMGAKSGAELRIKTNGLRKEAQEFPLEWTFRTLVLEGEALYISIARDLSAQTEARKALENERSRLFQTESLLKSAIRSSNAGFAIQRLDGRFTEVNEAFAELFGYSPEEMVSMTFVEMSPPEEADNERALVNRLARGEVNNISEERRYLRKDGRPCWVLLSASRVLNQEGEAVFLAAQVVDIDQEKRLALELELRALELERSNQDLDRFAYVASHDLKSPLRGIAQLANWIEEDSYDQLNDETRSHLAKMKNRVARLEKLLDDLLAYSRAGKREETVSRVDVKELAQSTFELLAPPPTAKLVIDSVLPNFETSSAALQLVFRNLLSNALKHFEGDACIIRVSAQVKRGYYEFCIDDNGPGIPVQFQEKVFEMFQTLKPRDEVEGSGMGLALVRKVVQQQGGQVWLVSDGKKGTQVYFTWPR